MSFCSFPYETDDRVQVYTISTSRIPRDTTDWQLQTVPGPSQDHETPRETPSPQQAETQTPDSTFDTLIKEVTGETRRIFHYGIIIFHYSINTDT